jgi:membrane-bound lytic murein transglycosylase D
MLNKRLNRVVLFLLILFLSVLYTSATINTIKNRIDSAKGTNSSTTSLMPGIPLHPSMENFIANYNDEFEELFEKIKLNKSGFLKTIDKVFTQQNVPVELKYLAIVESQLKTDARSGVGAVGLWQFMPGTAKTFGLKITTKYDERKHVWKSSVAAAKYLQDLHAIFGDWLLVVASYNSGPAPVLKAIKKTGSRNFWKIQNLLPKETRNHVKRFIATHYYFEGDGSLVTLGKAEAEKYLKALEEFNANNDNMNSEENNDPAKSATHISQWIAVINQQKDLNLILKK